MGERRAENCSALNFSRQARRSSFGEAGLSDKRCMSRKKHAMNKVIHVVFAPAAAGSKGVIQFDRHYGGAAKAAANR